MPKEKPNRVLQPWEYRHLCYDETPEPVAGEGKLQSQESAAVCGWQRRHCELVTCGGSRMLQAAVVAGNGRLLGHGSFTASDNADCEKRFDSEASKEELRSNQQLLSLHVG